MDIGSFYHINKQLQKREAVRTSQRYALADLERKILNEYVHDEYRSERTEYYQAWDDKISKAYEEGIEEDRQLWTLRKRMERLDNHYGFTKKKSRAILYS